MSKDEPTSDAQRVANIVEDLRRPFDPASLADINDFLHRVQHHRVWLVEAWWRLQAKMDQQEAEIDRLQGRIRALRPVVVAAAEGRPTPSAPSHVQVIFLDALEQQARAALAEQHDG